MNLNHLADAPDQVTVCRYQGAIAELRELGRMILFDRPELPDEEEEELF